MKNADLKFKYFLLNEDTEYLAGRMGDILNSLQDIQQNIKGMGTRQLVHNTERVVNQIRRILHTNWGTDTRDQLEMLQRVAVAIKKGIEEKDDLEGLITNGANEIQDTLADMGVPINAVGSEKKSAKIDQADQTAPPQGKEIPKAPPAPPATPTAPPVLG